MSSENQSEDSGIVASSLPYVDPHNSQRANIENDSSTNAANFDVQGIVWSSPVARQNARERRLAEYRRHAHRGLWWPTEEESKRRHLKMGEEALWKFFRAYKSVKSSIDHFQLRHLISAHTNSEVFYVSESCLYGFDTISEKSRPIHSEAAHLLACATVKNGYGATGDFNGHVTVTRLRDMQKVMNRMITGSRNSICNFVDLLYSDREDSPSLLICNNDKMLRELSMDGDVRLEHSIPWEVNHASSCPEGKLICVTGDDSTFIIMDKRCVKDIARVTGHSDHSFSSSWHPHGFILATGNQDETCKVWDFRFLKRPIATLYSEVGAVRSVFFSPDGNFLAFAEPADFVHIYDLRQGALISGKCKTLDFFGSIAGMNFSPDSEKLFIGVCDDPYGCLLEYRKRHGAEEEFASICL
eukprot:GHVL01000404.1.p1 GENE.GHVL01000404.1~~GHVL01000404.1.p1  ORF type:complete len:413 (+),score=49.16 GHVL01000404.1:137-1375(+)